MSILTSMNDRLEWRYVPRLYGPAVVKHAVWLRGAERKPDQYAICGVGPAWFSPSDLDGWRDDAGRLEALPKCRRCARQTERWTG